MLQWCSESFEQQPTEQTNLDYKKDDVSMLAKLKEFKIDDNDEEENEKANIIKLVSTEELKSLMWHYRDPEGRVQGPFSMVAFKGWSDAHYFPPDFKV